MLSLVLSAATGASLPSGWWIVEAAGGKDVGTPGAAWRFRAPANETKQSAQDEIFAVDADHVHARRSELTCRAISERVWRCERTIKVGKQYLHLLLRDDGELVGTAGRDGETPFGQMTARHATTAEAAQLDSLAIRTVEETKAACGRARRCYVLACPELGQADDPCIFEQHSMSQDAASCTQMVPMLVSVLQKLGKPVPAECLDAPATGSH